jgi:hypothetical protein
VKRAVNAQQVINRLAERSAMASQQPVECRLGSEELPQRGKSCSACTVRPEFELDQAVAGLINAGAFKGSGMCPYRVISNHLVAGLVFSPEAARAKSAGRYLIDPVVEIKGALKRIGAITRATRWSREDIEALSNKDGLGGPQSGLRSRARLGEGVGDIQVADQSPATWTDWSTWRSSSGARPGNCLAHSDPTPAGEGQ